MRRLSWKVSVAGAALVVTTVYAAAQMTPGQMPQGPMPPEQMMGMMKQMSPDDGSLQQHDAGRPARPQGRACHAGEEGLKAGPIYRCEGPTSPSFKSESREKHR